MTRIQPHRGYPILAVCFISLGLLYGIWYSYSVFLLELVRDLGWTRSLASGALSLFILVHGLSGFVTGRAVEKFGSIRVIATGSVMMASGLFLSSFASQWWHLYLSFGLLAAIGLGLCGWIPTILLVERWFTDRAGTALGVATAGIGIGMLSLGPFVNQVIEWWDWQTAFRMLAGLVLLWVLPATLLILREPETSRRSPASDDPFPPAQPVQPRPPEVVTEWSVRTALRAPRFWFTVLGFGCAGAITQMLLFHQFAFMVDHHVDKTLAALLLGVIGLTSVPGKIFWGALSDHIGRETTFTLAYCCTIAAVGVLVLIGWYPEVWLLPFVFAIVVGMGYSANAPLIPTVTRDLFRGARFPSIFSTLSVFTSAGGASGALLGGWLHDLSGDYQAIMLVAVGLSLVAMLMVWCAAPRRPNPPPA